jgi:hypothetical protein
MWDQHSEEENWGFLLVDARNAFDEVNRTAVLWVVQHEWPSGCRFVFNSYRHWTTLIIRSSQGADFTIFLLSRKGVTPGCLLAMVAFGLAVVPLIRQLKREVHQVHQAWFADDAAAAADFTSIKSFMERLIKLGPAYGYFPEASKIILVVSEANKAAAEVYFRDMKFKVITGSRYLGGFIRSDHDLHAWLKDSMSTWEHAIGKLSMVATKYHKLPTHDCKKPCKMNGSLCSESSPKSGNIFMGWRKLLRPNSCQPSSENP